MGSWRWCLVLKLNALFVMKCLSIWSKFHILFLSETLTSNLSVLLPSLIQFRNARNANLCLLKVCFQKKLKLFKEEFEKNNIFEKEPDMPSCYYLARECEIARKKPDVIIHYYNCAIWELSTSPKSEVSRVDDEGKCFKK